MSFLSKFSVPAIFLALFWLMLTITEAFYAARGVDPLPSLNILSPFILLWLVGWWMEDDGRKYGMRWIHDLGLFLSVAGIFLFPYHIFKTRGVRGFVTLLGFIGAFAGIALIGQLVFFLLLPAE